MITYIFYYILRVRSNKTVKVILVPMKVTMINMSLWKYLCATLSAFLL